ncbi:MAG: alpha/beta fold hydrolase, partial [Myxococcota bacterium]
MLTFLLLAVLAADELPRRAMLGVYAGAARGGGTEIKGALPNSTASRLGLKAGDVILEVNGSKTPDSEALLNALARFRAGDSLTVTIKRKQSRLTLRGSAVERSREKWPGADVNYGAVPHRGGKLRTILVTPTAVKRPPVVFFIQGVSCYSTEWDDPGMALRQLFQPVVDSGFAVFRVEKLAVGDSEGPMRCRDASFSEELAGFESAYRALLRQPDLGPVYMVGHSMGGIQAPLLAQSVQVPAGVAVYGTVLEPWEEYLTKLFRVQPVIASGSDPAAAARRARLIAPVLRAY